ncbi:MAG: hypothetical protein HeimC2_25790 [Candidatus Heimdallarchaeota archaeon LC_2]|nr:MAG: hypothetical protein HeimC2_25790 [Candidatus Heimdallarchaeota archaeon LC_2]
MKSGQSGGSIFDSLTGKILGLVQASAGNMKQLDHHKEKILNALQTTMGPIFEMVSENIRYQEWKVGEELKEKEYEESKGPKVVKPKLDLAEVAPVWTTFKTSIPAGDYIEFHQLILEISGSLRRRLIYHI